QMEYTTLRRLLAFAAIIGATTGLAAAALAQPPPGGGFPGQARPGGPGGQGGRRGGFPGGGRQMSVAMLPVATLDAVVKLTPDQKGKITTIHDTFVKSFTGFRP